IDSKFTRFFEILQSNAMLTHSELYVEYISQGIDSLWLNVVLLQYSFVTYFPIVERSLHYDVTLLSRGICR
ncbi:hypothetical protein L9F63_012379, partial [Diploptera punctata]